MTAAATNRVSLAYVAESVYGVTPSGPPTLLDIRMTGESLKQTTQTARSAEIRSDRQVPDVVRTRVGADGDINYELFAGNPLDNLIGYAMQADSVVATSGTGSITCSITASTGTFTASAATPFSGFAAGEWVKFTGFANAANNGYFRVASIGGSGLSLVVDQIDDLVDESSVSSVVGTQLAYRSNGTTQTSLTIEKTFNDLSNTFEVFTGMVVDGMALSIPADGMISGSLSFMGKQAASGTSTVGDGSNTAATTNPVMNSVDSVTKFYVNDATINFISLDFSLSNNLRSRHNAGEAFASSIGAGSLAISGTFQAYFESADEMNLYLNGTATNLAVVVEDANGNSRVYDFPQVRLTSGQRLTPAQDQDVIMEIGFEAYVHPTLDFTLRVHAG